MKPRMRITKSLYLSEQGFSLVELIVVMGIFMAIIIISSEAFNRIISVSMQQTKSSESDTQGVVGLEMMRVDLEHAGYGLPWLLNFVADYEEGVAAAGSLAPGIDTEQFNDNKNVFDPNKVPRAVQAAESTTDHRDYLAIKSVLAGMNDTVKKWTYVQGLGTASSLKAWGSNDFEDGERVITLDSRTKRLVAATKASAHISYAITAADMTPPDDTGSSGTNFRPQNDTDFYTVYGVSKSTDLRVPYNRVDYYVKRPAEPSDMPTRCAPGTGILYKAVMSHSNGEFSFQYPLLECVADMQVIFSLDTNGDKGVDAHVAQDGLSAMTAKEIRQQLKEIRVYLVAHEGGKDPNFQHGSSTLYVGEFGVGRTLDLNALVGGADYKNYRWKTYKLVVVPKNILY